MTERLSVFVVVLSMIAKSHLEPIVHGFAPRINIFRHSVQWLAAAMDVSQGFAHALMSSIVHLIQHILNVGWLYFNYVIRLSSVDDDEEVIVESRGPRSDINATEECGGNLKSES